MKAKKTWNEKLLDSKDLPKIEQVSEKMSKRFGEGSMVIPKPLDVDEIMKKIPKGKLITINNIRDMLALKYNANICCPITTGIFAWISANAAEENIDTEKKKNPYWRTLKAKGELNPKYPGGIQHQMEMLEAEGHKIIQKGKKFFVADYEKKLFTN